MAVVLALTGVLVGSGCGGKGADQNGAAQAESVLLQLQQTNQELQRLRAENQELPRLLRDNEEVQRLRNETKNLAQLRAENQQLRSQLEALKAPKNRP